MAVRIGRDRGVSLPGPIRSRHFYKSDNPASSTGPASKIEREFELFRQNEWLTADELWDFNGKFLITGSLPDGITSQITKTAGTPTVGVLANTANGVAEAALDAASEVQFAGLTFGDQLVIPGTRRAMLQALVRIPTSITTAQDVVIGLGTAYNATLASTTKFVWFRLTASMAVLLEGKDGTNTFTAVVPNPAFTLVANQWYLFSIVIGGSGTRFFIDQNWINPPGMALTSFAATDLLQPILGVRKSTGTTTPTLDVDMLRVSWDRYGS